MTDQKNKELLLIFVKNPEKGKVKTRLASSVGDEKALQVYQFLTKHTRDLASPIAPDIRVCYSNHIDEKDVWPEDRFQKDVQYPGMLGERMEKAFEKGFSEGYERIAIIGSDCYALTTDLLKDAFNSLRFCDLTIGPAEDGGYYLLGMNKLYRDLFRNKVWSTDEVLPATLEDATRLKLSFKLLPTLPDIDREEDLAKTDIHLFM